MTQVPLNSTSEEGLSAAVVADASKERRVEANRTSPRTQIGAGLMAIRSSSLSQLLLSTVLPLALAPLVVASVAGYTITQNRVQEQVKTQLEGQALLTTAGAAEELAQDLETLAALALNPFVGNLSEAAGDFAESEGLAGQPIQTLEERFAETKQVSPNQALNDYLRRYIEVEGFAELILTDRNGLTVGFSNEPSTFTQTRDVWWQQGRAQTQWIGDPERDDSAGVFGVSLSQRIEDPDSGEFLGVMKVFSSSETLNFLNEYLRDAGISGSQQVQLLDLSSGFTLARFSPEGITLPADTSEAVDVIGGRTITEIAALLVETVRTTEAVDTEALRTQLAEIYPITGLRVRDLSQEDGEQNIVISFDYADKEYALSTTAALDWVAIASMDISEIRAQGRDLLAIYALIALALGVVAALVTAGLSNRISSPLGDLSTKAQQVSGGNFNVVAEPKGTSETQTLAVTFNELVAQVRGFLGEQALNTRKATLFADITGSGVTRSEQFGELFGRFVDEARDIVQADRLVIYQFDPSWEGQVAAESVAENLPSAFEQGLRDACIPESTREKYLNDEVWQAEDIRTAPLHPKHRELLENLGVESVVAAAVKAQGQLYGLVIAHHCRPRQRWQAADVEFMQQLGLQLGQVIERTQLLEQTEALAREQQQIKEGLQSNALTLLMDVDPVSRGDLTVRAQVTEDEIGTIADSYNATITSLRKIVGQVKAAAEQVVSTTSASDESIRQLSTSALQQANEIAAALAQAQEVADSVRQVAKNAQAAEEAMQTAAQTVQEGDDAMNRTVDGIMAIRETVAETAKKVKRLGESSQKISNVVNLISGFAAQTNMLALNASIEASRAGEGGKGFAVVAEEVRELARQSAEATTEIEKLVASIQAETNDVVVAMEEGTQQVVDGTELVNETRQSLNRITTTSEQISALVDTITQATVLQAQASESMTASMSSVAAISTQNSEEASQVSKAFEQLTAVAQALQEEVGRFKVS